MSSTYVHGVCAVVAGSIDSGSVTGLISAIISSNFVKIWYLPGGHYMLYISGFGVFSALLE